MKKIILSLLLFAGGFAYAQNDFMLTEQLFSRINKNPAATGNTDDINIFYMNRQQWVGFDGAPTTNLLNIHSSFENINSGFGLTFSHDRPGGVTNGRNINAKLEYAYHINMRNHMLLSFGLSAGIINTYFNPSRWEFNNEDHVVPGYEEAVGETKFDMDLGAEFSMKYVMAGVACTHLTGTKYSDLETQNDIARHVYAYVRGNIPLPKEFDLAPAFMYSNCKYMNCYEFNIAAFYKKLYWLGAGYRINANTFNAMIGAQWRMFRVGYSYDLSCGKLADFKRSTHEIMVSVNLNKPGANKDKTKTKYVRFM